MTDEDVEYGDPAEVEIDYEADEHGLKVVAVLGEASITVEHSWDGAEATTILTQALPQILARVQLAMEQEES